MVILGKLIEDNDDKYNNDYDEDYDDNDETIMTIMMIMMMMMMTMTLMTMMMMMMMMEHDKSCPVEEGSPRLPSPTPPHHSTWW